MIFNKKISNILALAASSRTNRNKLITLVLNEGFFLGIAPWMLLWPARLFMSIAFDIKITLPAYLTNFLSAFFILWGLFLSLWSVAVQWSQGQGTPSIKAPTRELVISGPYRWVRNPIQLGACLYVLGLGIWYDGILTGALAALVGLIIGTIYIILIEEHELTSRFGQSYINYQQRTPFLLPGCKPESRQAKNLPG